MVGAPRSCSVTGPTSWYVLVVLGLPSERFSAERAVLLLIVFLNMSGIDNAGITTVSGQTDVLYSVSSSSHPTFTTPFTYASSCRSQWLQLQLDGIPRYSVSYYTIARRIAGPSTMHVSPVEDPHSVLESIQRAITSLP
jgi:hypothetical protein